MTNFFDKFKLNDEKEELQTVVENIDNGVVFRGTNLWVLIFAIFVASLGLNVNSTAVIIGAMLISPLMGPIMGIGLGIGISDVPVFKTLTHLPPFMGMLLALGFMWVITTIIHKSKEAEIAERFTVAKALQKVDNVPLVAASQGMYDLSTYPTDHPFWKFLALTTGTGGSAIIIGSAAGVAVMGIEQINFMWYLKKISWLALIGFVAGILVFLLQMQLGS